MRDDVHVLRLSEPLHGSWAGPVDRWPGEDVLDFPSVAALVDRMRAAFFAGEADGSPVPACVELSAWQAFNGGRVSVDMPLRRPCPECAGRGEVSDEPCPRCHGTGDRVTIEPVLVFVPAGVRDGARFLLSVRVPAAPQTAVDLRVRVR